MASFFNRQPDLFDVKKRLGSGSNNSNNGSTNDAGSAVGERLSPDEADAIAGEPWVELGLAPSRNSLCSSVEAVMVDAPSFGGETSVSKDSRLSFSPVSLQSPKSSSGGLGKVEFESSLEQVKFRLAKDMLPSGGNAKSSTDWIWDWSSRPEANPSGMLRHRSGGQIGSTLTTPPNSPVPELSSSPFLRFEVIFGMVVSNLVTFVLGATIGFVICRKMAKSGGGYSGGVGSPKLPISYYYSW